MTSPPGFDHPSAPYQLEQDPIHGWMVLYAPQRALRPFDFSGRKLQIQPETDPFAEGREEITTPETYAIRAPGTLPDSPGWQVRIIPNKFPALAELADHDHTAGECPIPTGIHEVIIETPTAETHFTRLGSEQQFLVWRALRDRLRQLAPQHRLQQGLVFKNHGISAGASLAHSHSQLIATRYIPPQIQVELTYSEKFLAEQGQSWHSGLLKEVAADSERIVLETEEYLLFCPRCSRFGFEMHLYPQAAALHFHEISEVSLRQFTQVLQQALSRLELQANDPDYNLVLHTAPFRMQNTQLYCWHLEIYPRIAGIAGYELGAGCYVNALPPEKAARLLRAEPS